MKKYKSLIIIMLAIIMLFIMVVFGSLRLKNIDMSETRLLVTYWKEYLVGVILAMSCYLGINFLLKD